MIAIFLALRGMTQGSVGGVTKYCVTGPLRLNKKPDGEFCYLKWLSFYY